MALMIIYKLPNLVTPSKFRRRGAYRVCRKCRNWGRVLKSYEKILEPLGFVRTHRSHLVNLKYVLFIDGNGQIIMKDESKASISRRKKKDVMAEIRRSMAA